MKYFKIFAVATLFIVFSLVLVNCEKEIDDSKDIALNKLLVEKWDEFQANGDFDSVIDLYLDNAIRMNPNTPALAGKEAIRSSFVSFYENNNFEFKNTPVDVFIAGDYAIIRGIYKGYTESKSDDIKFRDEGKWMTIRKRQSDGSWKILFDIWNSDLPPVTLSE